METGQPSDGEWVLALTDAGSDARAIVTAWREEYDPEHLVADDDIRIDVLCGRGHRDGVRIWVRPAASQPTGVSGELWMDCACPAC